MEQKETKKRSSFMQNVLILMFAQIMVKVLGLVYKFVITNFEGFGDTGLWYYSAGYQIYSLLLALSSIGIPSVVSKLVSERIAKGDNNLQTELVETLTFLATSVQETKLRSSLIIKPVSLRVFL